MRARGIRPGAYGHGDYGFHPEDYDGEFGEDYGSSEDDEDLDEEDEDDDSRYDSSDDDGVYQQGNHRDFNRLAIYGDERYVFYTFCVIRCVSKC